jgi:hypothetical protein
MPRILSFIPPILALTPLWVLAQCCSSYSVKLMPSEWGRSQGKCPPKAELRGALTLLPLGMGGVPQCKRPPKAKPRGPLPCYTPRSRGVPKVRTLPRWSPRGALTLLPLVVGRSQSKLSALPRPTQNCFRPSKYQIVHWPLWPMSIKLFIYLFIHSIFISKIIIIPEDAIFSFTNLYYMGIFFWKFQIFKARKDIIVFRFIIEYSSLRDFYRPLLGNNNNNRSIFIWGFLKDDIFWLVLKLEIS